MLVEFYRQLYKFHSMSLPCYLLSNSHNRPQRQVRWVTFPNSECLPVREAIVFYLTLRSCLL